MTITNEKEAIQWMAENLDWNLTNSGAIGISKRDLTDFRMLESPHGPALTKAELSIIHRVLNDRGQARDMARSTYYDGDSAFYAGGEKYILDQSNASSDIAFTPLAAAVLMSEPFKEKLIAAVTDDTNPKRRKEAEKLLSLRFAAEAIAESPEWDEKSWKEHRKLERSAPEVPVGGYMSERDAVGSPEHVDIYRENGHGIKDEVIKKWSSVPSVSHHIRRTDETHKHLDGFVEKTPADTKQEFKHGFGLVVEVAKEQRQAALAAEAQERLEKRHSGNHEMADYAASVVHPVEITPNNVPRIGIK